jgi:uncharacterized membrane protein
MHLEAVMTEHLRVPPHSVRLRRVNVGTKERVASSLLGAGLGYLATRQKTWWAATSLGVVAAFLAKRGLTGRCGLYTLLHVGTASDMRQRGVDEGSMLSRARARLSRVQRSVTINRPRHELFAYWRELTNLPRFMQNLKAVQILDERHSRWVSRGRGGILQEWESEIESEIKDEHITWLARRDSEVLFRASIKFRDAGGNRGTEVSMTIGSGQPGGAPARALLAVLMKEPDRQVRTDLHRFKQLMEAGEIVTAAGPSAR